MGHLAGKEELEEEGNYWNEEKIGGILLEEKRRERAAGNKI